MVVDCRNDPRYGHLRPEQVREHYEVEKRLARAILDAPPGERAQVASWAYEELFRKIPWHPALTEPSGADNLALIRQRARKVASLLSLPKAGKALEIGCGMGELCFALAGLGFRAVGVDISERRIGKCRRESQGAEWPKFYEADASSLAFGANEFDGVVSMQLVEHLHPEDVPRHLQEVLRVLRPGGCYALQTPHRLFGPGDVSGFFVNEPDGLHLREYSTAEMISLLKDAGFGLIRVSLRYRRILRPVSALLLEKLYGCVPGRLRRRHSLGLDNPVYLALKG